MWPIATDVASSDRSVGLFVFVGTQICSAKMTDPTKRRLGQTLVGPENHALLQEVQIADVRGTSSSSSSSYFLQNKTIQTASTACST